MATKSYDVVIIGAGVAGLSAAIYAARARLKTIILERGVPGGQLATTADVENYPGFPHISGPDLMTKFEEHAVTFGTEIAIAQEITRLELAGTVKRVHTVEDVYETKAVILAMGAEYRKLGVTGEDRLRAKGVSYCATCDGAFFRDRELVVIGGGDTAVEEGNFLTKFASKVTLIHRRDSLRATKILQERAFANPKMQFIWDSVVEEVLGDAQVEAVRLKNLKTGEQSIFKTEGVFIFVGMIPNTGMLQGQVQTDEGGHIPTDETMATNVPGVFAIGDVRQCPLRQAVCSANDGAIAAVFAEKYIETLAEAGVAR